MKIITLLFYCLILLHPLVSLAEERNAGFVQGLWYTEGAAFVDIPLRIYVAIRNNTGGDLTGTVEFYVNDVRIERNIVRALDGRIIESWADWTPTYGTSTIRAALTRTKVTPVGSSTQSVDIREGTSFDIIFVDYDTDGDGIGNIQDTDDDGDGITDSEEIQNGTDPLIYTDTATKNDAGDSSNEDAEVQSASHTANNAEPEGFERYLTNSPADNALGSITETINTTKKRIDEYREERNAEAPEQESSNTSASETSTSSSPDYTESGFGTITRTESSVESNGIVSKVFGGTKTLIAAIYTFILFILSIYLSHPAFVQITLLLLILFILFKLAKRLAGRPQ